MIGQLLFRHANLHKNVGQTPCYIATPKTKRLHWHHVQSRVLELHPSVCNV